MDQCNFGYNIINFSGGESYARIMTKIELSGVLGKNFGKVHHRLFQFMKQEQHWRNNPDLKNS
jgi:hypothetical protein